VKKLLWSAAIIALLVLSCMYTSWRVETICEDAADLLEQAETEFQLGDYQGAEDTVYLSKAVWDRHEYFLGLALRHTESDDVGILYPALLETCRQGDHEEFSLRNLELIAILRHLGRMEQPYLFNIL
jgi:hypothetical protein